MKKESLQAFNDGVVAIIITLMVLNIHAPGTGGARLAAADFWEVAREIGVYALTFVIVAIFWMNTHVLLDSIECVGHGSVWLNLLLLFSLSLTPLPTETLAEHPRAVSAHLFFGAVMTFAAVAYAIFHRAIEADLNVSDDAKHSLRSKNTIAALLFAASLPLAVVSTWISLGIFVLVPAIYFLPSRHLVRAIGEQT